MNENSSKQVLLSVLGIAVLVVAVVGVSFAFFTYSRQGSQENVLTTGEIFFDFTETAAVDVVDAFPGDAGNTMTFKVIGRNESTTPITYTVYGEVMEVPTEKVAFKSGEVLMTITPDVDTYVTTNNYSTATAAPLTGTGTDNTLVVGTIPAGQTSNLITSFTVNLKVANDVTISDTDDTKDYCSATSNGDSVYDGMKDAEVKCAGDRTHFDDLYYGIKIRIDADATR